MGGTGGGGGERGGLTPPCPPWLETDTWMFVPLALQGQEEPEAAWWGSFHSHFISNVLLAQFSHSSKLQQLNIFQLTSWLCAVLCSVKIFITFFFFLVACGSIIALKRGYGFFFLLTAVLIMFLLLLYNLMKKANYFSTTDPALPFPIHLWQVKICFPQSSLQVPMFRRKCSSPLISLNSRFCFHKMYHFAVANLKS